ncbi:hypothetical protein [Pseudomonas sp. KNUC1026]|uniref:hypothetical protein n=1 Tax=Pseudomonas sp. KNUC1026 TaxID=2893890 RepID=UPI001F3C49DE|nr:hypothetical protein [Pseudomonas sp. KNUC1026]UFH49986.1 hypothetical protein LN139_01000 [Pseudomonas sp. KNUC1026]
MKLQYLIIPFTALAPCASFAATPALQTFVACDANSLSVVEQPGFKERVPSKRDNGKIVLSGGSKTDAGVRWMFDKPLTLEGLTLTGFFLEDQDLMGSRIIGSGFYTQEAPEKAYEQLKKVQGSQLESTQGIYARAQAWSGKDSTWVAESSDDTAGKLVTDTAERILMVEPASPDAGHGSKGMVTCSVQGKVTTEMLKTTRPDLIK